MLERLLGHIPPDHYWRNDIVAQEAESVFAPTWVCVAFTDDLRSHHDFVTTQIGSHAIVVQNFRGTLKAFRNVCSHRFSRIQTEPCGNRPLTCPYHGWSYDADGIPIGIPFNAAAFNFGAADRAQLALGAYELETCGRFVFVRMKSGGPSLRAFLGRVHDDLEHFSEVCGDRIATTRMEVDVNWKIGLENAAEGYHIPLAHRESLGTTLQDDMEVELINDHSVFYRSLTGESRKWWQRVSKTLGMTPSDRFPHSTNYIIFPNSVILATYGASFVYQTYEPLLGDRYCLKSTYWMAQGTPGQARQYVADALIAFSERIMGEDRAICENAQAGVRDAGDRPALLGAPESRVAHFQRAYAKAMNLPSAIRGAA